MKNFSISVPNLLCHFVYMAQFLRNFAFYQKFTFNQKKFVLKNLDNPCLSWYF